MTAVKRIPIPVVRGLRKLGRDLQEARRRRRIPTELLAERAQISRTTLNKIENGGGGVSMAHYASVMYVLDFLPALENLADASNDRIGQNLESERLPERVRRPSPRR